jgi:hypothetical protein
VQRFLTSYPLELCSNVQETKEWLWLEVLKLRERMQAWLTIAETTPRIISKVTTNLKTADPVSSWDFKKWQPPEFYQHVLQDPWIITMMITMIVSILFNVRYNENTLSSFANRCELARSVHWELSNVLCQLHIPLIAALHNRMKTYSELGRSRKVTFDEQDDPCSNISISCSEHQLSWPRTIRDILSTFTQSCMFLN